jgi:LacI family transcriptional regulator, galactose operon repressor
VVCIDRLPTNWNGDSVTADNEAGAYHATRHLIQLGHRRLSTITGPRHLTNAEERLAGFKRAMREAKLPLAPEYVQETSFDRQGGHAKTLILVRLIPRPTAIVAGNDMMALGALLAIREAGLRCPDDISLIGFDDLDLAETTNPSLSSVSQSGYQLGTTAARLLLERKAGDISPAKHVILPTSLTLRNSVAPPADPFRGQLAPDRKRQTRDKVAAKPRSKRGRVEKAMG